MEIEFYQSNAIENSQMEHLRSCCFSCARVPFYRFPEPICWNRRYDVLLMSRSRYVVHIDSPSLHFAGNFLKIGAGRQRNWPVFCSIISSLKSHMFIKVLVQFRYLRVKVQTSAFFPKLMSRTMIKFIQHQPVLDLCQFSNVLIAINNYKIVSINHEWPRVSYHST